MSWHVDGALLSRYAGGGLDQARAASIEAHVIACRECRARCAPLADAANHEAGWTRLLDTIEQPRRRAFERLLARVGVREHQARLIAATPSLTVSWFVAVGVALAWALIAAESSARGVMIFLVMAPLIPLAGVAVAYGPGVDPAYEVGLAAPMRSLRLLLLRAGAVLGSTILLTGLASVGLDGIGWKAVAWLLPAMGVTLASLALSTWIEPMRAATIVGISWVATAVVSGVVNRGLPLLNRNAAFEPAGQAAFLILIAIAAAVLALRVETFETGRDR